jgi:peptidoglycan/LPS O-acetylase OafA/YrhL
MQSKNVAYIPRLDHLRFFAATIVFYFHMSHFFWLGWKPTSDKAWAGIITEGHTGVGLFFTLSGFLFMLIALGTDKINYKKFMINRVLRIFPLFIFVFIIAISMSRDVFTGSDIFYILFSNLGKAPTSNYFITGAAWTISIEFTFYAVFPFLAMFAKDRGIKYLIALIGLILVFKVGAYWEVNASIHMYYSTLLGRFDQFLVGMVFAILHYRYKDRLQRMNVLAVLGAAVLVLSSSAVQSAFYPLWHPDLKHPMWIIWSLQEAMVWGVFILVWINARFIIPKLLDRLMLRGGEISFSIYLLHAVVISLVHKAVGNIQLTGRIELDLIIIGTAVYALVWAIASISYETIEKPFLSLRQRYI